jgi:hypothetical protein
MKKIIRETDQERGIVQVTVADERWYFKEARDGATGNPTIKAVPSVTWIAGFYPKGIHFYKWLAEKGWDEAEALKQAAGDKGSKVHDAISAILRGEEVRIDSKFENKSKSTEDNPIFEELAFEEIECIISFLDWKKEIEEEYVLESLAWDTTVFSEIHGFAGTLDWLVRVSHRKTGEVSYWIIDFKTSQYVWTEYQLQISAYRRALENGENPILYKGQPVDVTNLKTAILQLGYRKNKKRFKFTPVDDAFDMFLTAQTIWAKETAGQEPRKVDIPIVLSPALTVDAATSEAKTAQPPLEAKPKHGKNRKHENE